VRASVGSSVAVAAIVAACGCASLWATSQAKYGAAEDTCIEEASTRAQADACRCQVRAQYPDAPQCTPLTDGGWRMPPLPAPLISHVALYEGGDQ
jgi:hypothetical protein